MTAAVMMIDRNTPDPLLGRALSDDWTCGVSVGTVGVYGGILSRRQTMRGERPVFYRHEINRAEFARPSSLSALHSMRRWWLRVRQWRVRSAEGNAERPTPTDGGCASAVWT